LLITVHAISYLSRSFLIGLWTGILSLALCGIFATVFGSDSAEKSQDHAEWPSAWLWIGALGATSLMALAAIGWYFHDELFIVGHMSIVAEIQNNFYPPQNLAFAEFELRYHYGFALLTAIVTALFRLRIDVAIDFVTLLLSA